MKTYKVIKRWYYEDIADRTGKWGYFIARGQWADGHLAYTRLDEKGNEVEETCYVQLRRLNGGLFMARV